ncbi:hypothetical protein AB0L88_05955 [Saccharopolyspora shandongensis]|uniref:terminase gpP N-terminus-related DNA-binding protein n=1 Tax=Saccharopolyspora shandongensis TaxID=418495 RepID=UPI00343A1627
MRSRSAAKLIDKGVAVRRDRAAMEAVRMAAAELFEQGFAQAEVARLLDASRQNVHYWHRPAESPTVAAISQLSRRSRRSCERPPSRRQVMVARREPCAGLARRAALREGS